MEPVQTHPVRRDGRRLLAALLLVLFVAGIARADVVGRLRFTVKNAADEKVVSGAKIVLKDTANVRPNVTLTTDASGIALTPPIENRAWSVSTSAETFQTDTRNVTVVADVTTDVEILLEPLTEKVITIRATRNIVTPAETGTATRRDQNFIRQFPANVGNPQSLTKTLRTVPGMAEDSVNQVHPRNEHSATAIYINGFLLPGVLQGRAGQFLAPDAVETLDVQTGGYAPEYGGETAAILNLTLRSGTLKPFIDATLMGGAFSTFNGALTFGGQAGAAMGEANAEGLVPRRFSYFVNLTQRNTANAIEPPQPDRQTAHNDQSSSTFFGNFQYTINPKSSLTFVLNAAPARTEIANRTGLPAEFEPFGQGFGYGGELSAADAAAQGILSQEALRQDIYQRDQNTFGLLQYRSQFNDATSAVFSLGYAKSRLDILNNNPAVDLFNLPDNSSIEFNPTIRRDYDQFQIQGHVTRLQGRHTLKFGALYADQSGDESYNLIPASRTALAALAETDPRLAPQIIEGEDGLPVVAPGSSVPTLNVRRDGYYAALYGQDTFSVTPRFTVNYGFRLDSYKQDQNLGQENVSKTEISPRVNLAYAVQPRTIVRASYNRLFTQPPLAQGAIIGSSIQPQMAHMYEGSVEQQIGANQRAKVAVYQKDFRNQLDTALLLEGTQIGAFTTVNLEKTVAKGVEFSYDFLPRNNVGFGGYFVWANSINKPSGSVSTGEEVEPYTDHDQLNTLGAGISYTHTTGANAALNLYYGSGAFSSALEEDGKRNDRTEVNLLLSTGPRLLRQPIRVDLAVENLFDSREVINFRSPFSGTRFQQGRRVFLSVNGRF
jgi:outer membrane receptor protein involved in Fe transport